MRNYDPDPEQVQKNFKILMAISIGFILLCGLACCTSTW